MIKLSSRGSFKNTMDWLKRRQAMKEYEGLDKFGAIGVTALKQATPVDSGATQEGWYYEIIRLPGYYSIQWLNSHVGEPGHIPIAVLIQFGHATGNGGYVQGRDYINPAMRPIFDQIANEMWREVTR